MLHRNVGLAALLLFVLISPTSAQQRRTITGQVVEEGTGRAISGAQLLIRNTNTGSLSREDGGFVLSAPPGPVTLVVIMIGYKRVEVEVPAATNNVQISLGTDVLNLNEIVVTGQATGTQRRNLANSVAKVNSAELVKAPTASLQEALMGKVAGAQIYSNSGAPGGGMRVRLRGLTSINGGASPLYVIDGVVVSDVAIPPGTNIVTRASGGGIAVASQETPVNRIADLNPYDIESVEVLKGAAASAIYGSKASNGVIIITTKRGRPGSTSYSVRQGFGTAHISYKLGLRRFTTLADAVEQFGPKAAEYWSPDLFFDHEDEVFGRTPLRYETSVTASGGTDRTRYYASVGNKHEGGIVNNTFSDKQDVRLNLDQQIGDRMTARLTMEGVRSLSDRGLFNNDNTATSLYYVVTKIPSFLDIRKQADGSYLAPWFVASNPLQTAELFENREHVWRSIVSANLTYDLLRSDVHTLKLMSTSGADVFHQKNALYSPPELVFEDDDGFPGTSGESFSQNVSLTLNTNLVHSFKPSSGAYSATSSVGIQYESRELDVSRVVGRGLLGARNFDVASVQVTDNAREEVKDLGFFVQEEVLAFNERLMLTAGLRGDRSSANGDPGQYYYYPKASASFRFPQLVPGKIGEVKLRAAFGQSGNQPLFEHKFTRLNTGIIAGVGGFTLPSDAGQSAIVPERQKEIEGGIDATLFNERATLEVTGYQKTISDLLLRRTLAPTSGFGTEFFNGGEMRVRGLEVGSTAAPLRGALQWIARVNFSLSRPVITKLPVPPFLISSTTTGALRIEEGLAPTTLWGNDTVTGPHADIPQCVNTAPGAVCVYPHKMGDSNPKYVASLSNEFNIGGLHVSILVDGQKGGMQGAGTWRHFDLGKNTVDYDEILPNGEKAGANRVKWYRNVTTVYFQDISFIKLREWTVGYEIPRSVMESLRLPGRTSRVSLSGRELYTWTKYRGGDPEYNTFSAGTASLQVNRELMAYPPSRSFWFHVDISF